VPHMPEKPRGPGAPEGNATGGVRAETGTRAADLGWKSLDALMDLTRTLDVILDERQLASAAMMSVMGHIGSSVAAIWLADDSHRGGLRLVESSGIPSAAAEHVTELLARAIGTRRFEQDNVVWLTDYTAGECAELTELGMASRLVFLVPITVTGERIGCLGIGRRANGQAFSAFDVDMVRTMLRVLGVAIGNVRLYANLNRRNRELEEANQSLRELDRMKSEFLQTVNHELKTPITVILGAVECVAPPVAPLSPDVDFVGMIRDQAGRLREMVQNMLEFTALTGTGATIKCAFVDMRRLVTRFADARRTRVEKGGRELTLRIDDGVPAARCNDFYLERALDRLLENATKFTPAGTAIEIALTTEVDERGTWVATAIHDHGPGISPEDLQRLFRAFQQVDSSTTREHGGLGLGLAVAKRAVELMGGRVVVDSAPGAGSTFRILLAASMVANPSPLEAPLEP
jgi:signal transduction histidine kinase